MEYCTGDYWVQCYLFRVELNKNGIDSADGTLASDCVSDGVEIEITALPPRRSNPSIVARCGLS